MAMAAAQGVLSPSCCFRPEVDKLSLPWARESGFAALWAQQCLSL